MGLQRRSSGDTMITFSRVDYCNLFLAESAFSSFKRRYSSNLASEDLEYLTIFAAPHELPDVAIEQYLKPFCQVVSKCRNHVRGYREVCKGIHTYHVCLLESVPRYLRFGKFQMRFQHVGQTKMCCCCGAQDHLVRDCTNDVCFNCDTLAIACLPIFFLRALAELVSCAESWGSAEMRGSGTS